MPEIKLNYMPSSVVANMFYNENSKVLRIAFVSGAVYEYLKVPNAVYKAMSAATSKGTYLNRYIKKSYSFRKIK